MQKPRDIIVAQKLSTRISENEDFWKQPGQNRFFAAYQLKGCIKRLFSLPTKWEVLFQKDMSYRQVFLYKRMAWKLWFITNLKFFLKRGRWKLENSRNKWKEFLKDLKKYFERGEAFGACVS